MQELKSGSGNVTIVDLSRDFSQQLAITVGLDQVVGDAIGASREFNRFLYYLYAWVGFAQKAIP